MLYCFVRINLTNSQLNELPGIPFVANQTVGVDSYRALRERIHNGIFRAIQKLP